MFDSGRPQETKVTLSHSVFITGHEGSHDEKSPSCRHVRIQQAYRIHACGGGIYPVYNVIANMSFFHRFADFVNIFQNCASNICIQNNPQTSLPSPFKATPLIYMGAI